MGIVKMKRICLELEGSMGARSTPLGQPGQIIRHNYLLPATNDAPDFFQDAGGTPQTGAAGTIRITIHRTGGRVWEILGPVINIGVWFDR
jgi:hypothetical protein